MTHALNVLCQLQAGQITEDQARSALEALVEVEEPLLGMARGADYGLMVSGALAVDEVRLLPWCVGNPRSGEVTIEVHASALNFPDLMCLQGLYPTIPTYPFVPGFEVAGTVVHVGPGVSALSSGDEVVALTGRELGGHAGRVNVPASCAVKKPRNLSFAEACSLPVVFATVQHAFDVAKLRAGEHVLVHTATGGCGLMGIQLARARGATVYGSSSREGKLDVLRRLGVAEPVDYSRDDFDRALRRQTAGRGMDVVLNMLSGAAIQRGLDCLAPGGRYLELAVHGLRALGTIDVSRFVDNQVLHSIDVRKLAASGRLELGHLLAQMVVLAESGQLVPITTRTFPVERARDALACLQRADHIGKIVLTHDGEPEQDLTEPCIERLLERERARTSQSVSVRSELTRESAQADAEGIAIIGVSGRFPGAGTLDEFWDNVRTGRDCVTEVPRERWDAARYYDPDPLAEGKSYSKWLGALTDVDCFDPLFFSLSPAEAAAMDPQQRLFLESCWHCLENAGVRASSLAGSRCAVFVGCGPSDYGRAAGASAQGLIGGSPAILAARISYTLDLKGPCAAIDTACSSALVALATGCDSLLMGRCDLVLAGGVSVLSGPSMHIATSKAGMLSPDGRCYTFDARANGFVPGEAVGVVLLKRLSDALRDGDTIHAVVRGWGVNQDGKTNGITAPSASSQVELLHGVWQRFDVAPETLTLIEAHGTGTKLGDPIEVDALVRAFGESRAAEQRCALGSVKSNIGHCLAAAGIAGLLKLVLALRHRTLPPAAHFHNLNEHISFDGSPLFVNTRAERWDVPHAGPRRAAVSSFGFSGTNAHVVLEEAPARVAPAQPARDAELRLFVLSAKSLERLREYARTVCDFVSLHADLRLLDLAYTMQVGREPLEWRMACTASSLEELRQQLASFAAGSEQVHGLRCAELPSAKERARRMRDAGEEEARLQRALREGVLEQIAEHWLDGAELQWDSLYPGDQPRRVEMPGYPFARERYWIATDQGEPPTSRAKHLHPLLHDNNSDLDVQRFSSRFDGNEPFLRDHQVAGSKVLPASAILEMVRAGYERSTRALRDGQALFMEDVVWVRPIVVEQTARDVHLTLVAEDDEAVAFELHSRALSPQGELELNAHGRIYRAERETRQVDLALLQDAGAKTIAAVDCHALLERAGLWYGATFQRLRRVAVAAELAVAELEPTALDSSEQSYMLDPGLLDSAVRALVGFVLANQGAEQSGTALPYAVARIELFGAISTARYAVITRKHHPRATQFDVELCDPEGQVCLSLLGMRLRATELRATAAPCTMLFESVWSAPTSASTLATRPRRGLVMLFGVQADALPALQARCADAHCAASIVRAESLPERVEQHVLCALSELRALLPRLSEPTLVQFVVTADAEQGLLSALAALLRTVGNEQPRLLGQLLVVDRDDVEGLSASLERSRHAPLYGEIRDVDGEMLTRGLRALPQREADGQLPLHAGGVYLISGGTGKLGLRLARDLARRAPGITLVLLSRSSSAAAQELARALEHEYGVRVLQRKADVGDRAQVRALMAELATQGELRGIVHAASVLDDGRFEKKSAASVVKVLRPKFAGIVHLDEETRSAPLDFFVALSSVAGVLGNAGQSDYATANALLDAYAGHRNREWRAGRRQGRTLSLALPLVADEALRVDERLLADAELRGLPAVTPAHAFDCLHRAWATERDSVLLLYGLTETLLDVATSFSSPRARELPRESSAQALSAAHASVFAALEKVAQLEPARVRGDVLFEKYGLDSIMQVSVVRELEKTFGKLPSTLLMEHSSFDELTAYLAASHASRPAAAGEDGVLTPEAADGTQPASGVELAARSRRRATTRAPQELPRPASVLPMAVIGVSGRYPGANDLEEFWENLSNGRNCIEPIPHERWQSARAGGSSSRSTAGGFLHDPWGFDHALFGLTRERARELAPESRLVLETAWQAFEDAGYARAALAALQQRRQLGVGVFVGTMYDQGAFATVEARDPELASNQSAWTIANQTSHFFDLTGPSLAVNSACSSSLTAIHLACESLAQGSCAMALVAGVNLTLSLSKFEALQRARLLGSGERSMSFGKGDGYLPGEGVGAVLLKPLPDALADGDPIHGLIRASFVNHGGGRQAFGTPDPLRQASLIGHALERARVNVDSISYVEAAANGSELGDPIEVVALRKAFERFTSRKGFCALGSVKSNIGHLEAASGISQLTKVLLQLRHGQIAPTLHSSPRNPSLRLEDGPFFLQEQAGDWARGEGEQGREQPRRALVNSFGAGGAYASLVVEEYLADAPPPPQVRPYSFVLSASSHLSLLRQARRMALELAQRVDTPPAHVAWTLWRRNHDLPERLAIIASSIDELVSGLCTWVDAAGAGPALQLSSSLAVGDEASERLAAWTEGAPLDLESTFSREERAIVPLTHYQFERDAQADKSVAMTADRSPSEPGRASFDEQLERAVLERVASRRLSKQSASSLLGALQPAAGES